MARHSKVDWAKADWTKQDVVLAVELGCSRQRVFQVRAELVKSGKLDGVEPDGYRTRTTGTAANEIAKGEWSGKTVPEVALEAGCSEGHAGLLLRKAGKAYKKRPKGNSRYDWGKMPSNWKDLTDKEIAVIIGASSRVVVTQWRVRHGMRKRGET